MSELLEFKKNISVVIPLYNSEDTIIPTLQSVEKQTKISYIKEIIVIDDGSTDSSKQIVNNYIPICKIPIILISKKNGGVSSARNLGMEHSSGQWIALLDSDDLWIPEKIEMQCKILREHPEIDFLGGNMNETTLRIYFKKITKLYKANIKDVCITMFPQPSTVIFKKKIYEEIGGFDINQRYAEDGNYFLKICSRYEYYHLPIQLIYYGQGKRGFGVSGLSKNMREMYKGNIKNLKDTLNRKDISYCFYLEMRGFYLIKYIRRIVLTTLLKKGRNKNVY